MRTPSAPPQPSHNPHVSLLHRVLEIGMFLLGTPIAIWILITFALPFAATLLHRADAWVAWLQRVERCEAVQAGWASPAVNVHGTELLAEAWPYQWAHTTVTRILPQEPPGHRSPAAAAAPATTTAGPPDAGASAPSEASSEAPSEALSDAPRPSASGTGPTIYAAPTLTLRSQAAAAAALHEHPVVARLTGTARSWLQDRFLPIQTAWWSTTLTRGVYALQLLVIAVPACLLAYCLGEYRARARLQRGQQPMAHRFHWLLKALKHAITAIPVCIVLPVPLPTIPLLIGLYALVAWLIVHARGQFIEI